MRPMSRSGSRGGGLVLPQQYAPTPRARSGASVEGGVKGAASVNRDGGSVNHLTPGAGRLRAAGFNGARGSDSARAGAFKPGTGSLPGPPGSSTDGLTGDAVDGAGRRRRVTGQAPGSTGGRPASRKVNGLDASAGSTGGDAVGAAASAAHRASMTMSAPTGSNVGGGARGGGWSGSSRPADLHKHLAENEHDGLFDAETAASEEESEHARRVVAAVGTGGGAGFPTAVGAGPRSLSVAHINARDGTRAHSPRPSWGEDASEVAEADRREDGDGDLGSVPAIAAAAAAGLPDEVLERFAVLEEQLRVAERCAETYCRERDMALGELDAAQISLRDATRDKEALEEALRDAEDVAGQKTSAAAAMAQQLREMSEEAAASRGELETANRAAACATAAAAQLAAQRAAMDGGHGQPRSGAPPSSGGAPEGAVGRTGGKEGETGPMAEMREALQEISELQAKTAEAIGAGQDKHAAGGARGKAGGAGGAAGQDKDKDMALLQGRVEMSRSIMRKLYKKNVELEKENQLAKAAALREQERAAAAVAALAAAGGGHPVGQQLDAAAVSTSQAPEGDASLGLAAMGIGSPLVGASSVYVTMVRERDKTIEELRGVVADLKRNARAREGNTASSAAALSAADLQEVVSQSAQHFTKYKQIRADYRRLLNRRVDAVRRTGGANSEAKKVVEELHHRLNREIQEREAEAAIYSARLYETEQQQSDWYVEKRLLEGKVAKLDGEVAERDRLDAQIETCVAQLFERMRALERTNASLAEKLAEAGLGAEAAAATAEKLAPVEVTADVAKVIPALAEGGAQG